ncbi:MAG TPA: hypothetical protein VFZ34_20505 [Blastocatellia bacterium]|nr:hypothetical protein [Blastocatellia bacterium]
MTVRSWLQSLRKLTRQARALVLRCAAKLFPPFARQPSTPEPGTDLLLEQSQHTVRVLCSDVMQVSSYREWIAPLQKLPKEKTVAELQAAAEALPGFQPAGQHFFPLEKYLQATPSEAVELVQYGVAEKQTALDWFHVKTNPPPTEPAVLVIQNCSQESR